MPDISLTSATRQNLLSLQDTAALTATNQYHLATGKKVATALDNPLSFFTAQGLNNRSNDLSALLDGISNGIQTIQAANQGITNIQRLVDQAKSITSQALATQVNTTGTAGTAYAPAATAAPVNFYINGTAVAATIGGTGQTAAQAVAALNTASNTAAPGTGNIFSVDPTGTKIVLNAAADVEFKTSADQTALGFAAGSGTGPTYTAGTTVGQSANLTVTGVTQRAALASQYNALLTQIDQLAKDSNYNGVNLIAGAGPNNNLTINFNEKATSNLTVNATNETSSGLNLSAITATSGTGGTGNFLVNADINSTVTALNAATSQLRTDASGFGTNLAVVQNRQDFEKQIINVLQTGSGNLTNADMNAEAANSQALTTRQQLGISALSLANQAQQSVLQLLR